MSAPPVPPTTSSGRCLTLAEIHSGFDTRPTSNLLWTQEFLTCYGLGGCHPVRLGDTFKNRRYKVVRKLGHGYTSTVWLAQDTANDTLAALKIYMAYGSSTANLEIMALKALHVNAATSKLLPTVFDHFVHNGPNGAHQCVTMQVLGPSLRVVIDSFLLEDLIDPEDPLRLAKQVLEATATFHEAGFAHGDLDAGSIVFSINNLAHLSNEAFIAGLDELQTAELVRIDESPLDDEHLPKQLVGAAEWDDWIDEDEEDIRLIDVCDSFRVGDQVPSSEAVHDAICPPEALFEETFDYRVDLWRAGTVLYALVCKSCPFARIGNDDYLVSSMMSRIGALPSEWQPQWQKMCESSGHPDRICEWLFSVRRAATNTAPSMSRRRREAQSRGQIQGTCAGARARAAAARHPGSYAFSAPGPDLCPRGTGAPRLNNTIQRTALDCQLAK
ncbi:hypothetical protein LLEC1_00713 [Akanthomyces lecanii]|uniref:non-specific serine/threonine protein kinase n=1 Tax=Cordyceps confragosa TaxID=2714763 RepID=A0A179IC12_CORDF|nr:hypothetical protein LLEC1_00713 [Akanthomyces lecanii]